MSRTFHHRGQKQRHYGHNLWDAPEPADDAFKDNSNWYLPKED